MNVALVHDYLKEYGGAERVLETMHEMWPDAPLYTSFVDWVSLGDQAYRFNGLDIRTSWVQKFWLIKKFISPLRFLAPLIWGSFDLSGYDVVVSSSGWFMCRGVALATAGPAAQVFSLRSQQNFDPSLISFSSVYSRAGKEKVSTDKIFSLPVQSTRPVHICYIHHPPRNLYGYATGSDLQQYWVVRAYAAIINFFLRQYDFDSAQAVDYFVANSKETARRVEKFYRRNSVVVYPPIGISNINPSADGQRSKIQTKNQRLKEPKNYFLSVGRLTYAKRVDLAIQACNALKLPLKIVGVGKEEKHLRALALQGTSLHRGAVEFLGGVSDKELQKLYAGAKALIFSALDEDFGMVPVEAMAHGTPVIALAQGGVKETVVDGVTGVLFQEPTAESLEYAVKRFMGMEKEWSQACRNQAKKFSKERFKKEFLKYVNNVYKNTKKRL